MMEWRVRADGHVNDCCPGRVDLIGVIGVTVLDQCASRSDVTQASKGSHYMLKYYTNSETVLDLNACSVSSHRCICEPEWIRVEYRKVIL